MKRILFLALIIFVLFSCSDNFTVIENSESAEVSTYSEPQGTQYVINTNSKKYHIGRCPYATNMKSEYKKTSSDIEFLKERGYLPCSYCLGG